jgi:hypothetical protein
MNMEEEKIRAMKTEEEVIRSMTDKQYIIHQRWLRRLWDKNGMLEFAFAKGLKEALLEKGISITEAELEKKSKAWLIQKKQETEGEIATFYERDEKETIQELLQTGMPALDCAQLFNVDMSYIIDIQKSMKSKK